ncbi:hypothetical protein SAMN05421781_1605 [Marinococcus luteus]|uniref:YesK-like protein n=1 Tax=Marinococcus luteus TaxID=1122204 RepID=A0A1H2U8I4_9BACI|nr:hypothetical protein [Marinococcus luteus]SDW52188.1 hypothetical protein SAMN05421781_1605 [Marinococcus luteus]
MISGPFTTSILPGVIALLFTLVFVLKGWALWVKLLPGIALMAAAISLFYYGYMHVRGFEGASYGILGGFLSLYAVVCFVMAGWDLRNSNFFK